MLKVEPDALIDGKWVRQSGEPDCNATDLSGQPEVGLDVI